MAATLRQVSCALQLQGEAPAHPRARVQGLPVGAGSVGPLLSHFLPHQMK